MMSLRTHAWAQKLPAGRRSVREYRQGQLEALLDPCLVEYTRSYPDLLARYHEAHEAWDRLPACQRWPYTNTRNPVQPMPPDWVRAQIAMYDEDGGLGHEAGARQLLGQLEAADVVSNTQEWDLTGFSYEFLWFCHAIGWGIHQYDTALDATA